MKNIASWNEKYWKLKWKILQAGKKILQAKMKNIASWNEKYCQAEMKILQAKMKNIAS